MSILLEPVEGFCDTAKDIEEFDRVLHEVQFIGVLCSEVLDGDAHIRDSPLAHTVAAINDNCHALLQFFDDEGIDILDMDDK